MSLVYMYGGATAQPRLPTMSLAAAKKARREDERLNEDTEGHITDFLTPRELSRLRATEKRAQNRTYSAAITEITVPQNVKITLGFWKQYNLSTITEIDADMANLKDTDLQYLARQQCPRLTYLNLNHNTAITDGGVIAIAQNCPQLTSLNLDGCFHITDVGVIAIAQNCPQLSSLGLFECRQMSDEGVIAIAQNCPQLNYLDLSCTDITDAGVIALAQCLSLTTLDIRLTEDVREEWRRYIEDAQRFFDKYVRRHSSSASSVSGGAASQLVSAFGPLRF